MAEKKEFVLKLTDEQRAQIKNATGRDLTELKVDINANSLAANPLSDHSKPITVLEDRANPYTRL